MSNWRHIPGYDGYFASSDGQILSRKRSERILSPQLMSKKLRPNDRHLYVLLSLGDGRKKRAAVHQLVARAFIGLPPTNDHVVNHKNGSADDNRAENLEWVTRKENELHAAQNGLKASGASHGRATKPGSTARGSKHGRSKITEETVLNIRDARVSGVSEQEVARRFGVSRSLVGQISRGEIWTHINWRRATPILME